MVSDNVRRRKTIPVYPSQQPPQPFLSTNNNTSMGKTVQLSKENPFGERKAEVHALTRAEEEACYKDLKEKALEYCQSSIKGNLTLPFLQNVFS